MANPVRGEVELKLSGKTYPLRISLNVLAETQELLGLDDFNEIMGRLTPDASGRAKADFVTLRALVCAVLREHMPALGVKEAGSMIGAADLRPTMDAIAQALNRAFSGKTEDSEEAAPAGDPPQAAA